MFWGDSSRVVVGGAGERVGISSNRVVDKPHFPLGSFSPMEAESALFLPVPVGTSVKPPWVW